MPFEHVAARYSQDPEAKQTGGSLGEFDRKTFRKGRWGSFAKLQSALFSPRLKVGKLTTVQSGAGLHLLRIDTRKKPRKTFAQAREKLTTRLRDEAIAALDPFAPDAIAPLRALAEYIVARSH